MMKTEETYKECKEKGNKAKNLVVKTVSITQKKFREKNGD